MVVLHLWNSNIWRPCQLGYDDPAAEKAKIRGHTIFLQPSFSVQLKRQVDCNYI